MSGKKEININILWQLENFSATCVQILSGNRHKDFFIPSKNELRNLSKSYLLAKKTNVACERLTPPLKIYLQLHMLIDTWTWLGKLWNNRHANALFLTPQIPIYLWCKPHHYSVNRIKFNHIIKIQRKIYILW